MPSLSRASEVRGESNEPDSVTSLFAKLTRFEKTREANEIIDRYRSDKKRREKLLKLLETAPEDLGKKLGQIAEQVVNEVPFTRLRIVLQIQDVLKRRAAMRALCEDHGIDYKRF